MRFLHKWLSILIGLQVLIWVTSGTIISVLDHDIVKGRNSLVHLPTPTIDPNNPLFDLSSLALPPDWATTSIKLVHVGERVSYLLSGPHGSLLFDAYSGARLSVDQILAQEIAAASYGGDGRLASTEFLSRRAGELSNKQGALPQWRIGFNDSVTTQVYISAQDASVLAHRNNYSEVVDFLLMLHFMDYAQQNSFNNLQVRVVGFLALWLAISGLLLVQRSFKRRDFAWLMWRGAQK